MDRGEFLSILRESLEGYIPQEEIEENIALYRNYFDESGESDDDVIQKLGDPRLIARTIIDAYKASKGPMADYYTEQARREYSETYSERDSHQYNTNQSGTEKGMGSSLNHRLITWGIIILIFFFLLLLGIFVFGVMIRFFLPVILLIIVIKIVIDFARKI